jgi:hypothetical protein
LFGGKNEFFLDLWWHPTLAQIPNKPKQPNNHGTGGTVKKKKIPNC